MATEKVISKKRKSTKGEFKIDYARAIAEFENAMQKFPVKKILYKLIFRGKGLEFDSYRQFAPDDDADMIDWKASLRANSMLARKYIEERDLHIYFLIDVSSSMLFGSRDKLKAEYVAEMVASVGHLIIGSGDRVGLVMFNQGIVRFLRTTGSRNQLAILSKNLADSKLYGGGVNFGDCIDFSLGMANTPYTIFIIVSDFINVDSLILRKLKIMASKYETLAIMVRDPMDEELPNTKYQFSIQDPYSGRQMVLDPSVARVRYRQEVNRRKNIVRQEMKDSRVDLVEINTSKPFSLELSKFLRRRAKGGTRI